MSLDNNGLQFITLELVKSHFGFKTDTHDGKLLAIIQSCNLEIKKRIFHLVDDIDGIQGSIFFQSGFDAALIYCESEIQRQIYKAFKDSQDTMKVFESKMKTFVAYLIAQAPIKRSKIISSRDTDPEDEYFSERHTI